MIDDKFARLTFRDKTIFFKSLFDAYVYSDTMEEPHNIWAKDERGQYVHVWGGKGAGLTK